MSDSSEQPFTPLFDVVFYGTLIDGFESESVKTSFAKLFKLSNDKVDQIFASSKVVLKPNVTEIVAQKFQQALQQVGAEVELKCINAVVEPELTLAEYADESVTEPEIETVAEPSVAAVMAEPEASISDDEPRTLPFKFSGKGGEYFKIWIVNILLTIVTLGIYSAWAKVRNKHYFRGNTTLDGGSFAYLASPITILKGRLIAVACFMIYMFVSELLPLVGLGLAILLVLSLPWLVLRTMAFNARNTAYRNIKFNFKGNIKDAAIVFLGLPLLALGPCIAAIAVVAVQQESGLENMWLVGTVGALSGLWVAAFFPYMWFKQQQFLINGHSFGATTFEFLANAKDYYRIILILLGAGIVCSIAIALVSLVISFLAAIVMLAAYLYAIAFFQVSINNVQFNNTELAGHSFCGRWEINSYAWLFFVNTLLTVFTLGLFIPWAKVRTAHYIATHTDFIAVGSTQNFVAEQQEKVSAVGEELAGVFDVDFGL